MLIEQGEMAKRAANKHGSEIELLQNSAARIDGDLAPLIDSTDRYQSGKVELAARYKTQQSLLETSRAYLTLARDISKPILGGEYCERWDSTGLVGSLAIPQAINEVQGVLRSFHNFLTCRPEVENALLNITAQRTQELYDQLLAARMAVNNQKGEVDRLLAERNERVTAMRRRLRGLIAELTQLIDPTDWRWTAFGFNRPGAEETPEPPQEVQATVLPNHTIEVKWEATPRAEYYRVWKRVVNVDTEFLPIGSPYDLDFAIEELPLGTVMEIAVTAVNGGGESTRSVAVTVSG